MVPDWAAFKEAAGRAEPTVFRVRTGRVTEEALLQRLAARGFRTRPIPGMPDFHLVEDGPAPVSMTPEHWHGLLYVQQASTGIAAPALGAEPGERVLDLCAAPGGKTMHIAEMMEESGCVVASEISESRIRGLLGNVYRLGYTNVLVVAGDGRDFPEGASFDRVLVDAPCSGEGTLRRRGGRAPRQSSTFSSYVAAAQRGLLERAVRLTRPGGVVLYVTCTFAPGENEAIVSDALERLPVELEPLDLPVPHAPGITSFEGARWDPRVEGAARIYPQHLDSGGLFLARLRKLDDGSHVHPASSDSGQTTDATTSNGSWSAVPLVFPGDDLSEADARDKLARARDELTGRFGVVDALDRLKWVFRGGRAWVHTLDSWPTPAWDPGAWRAISVGLRAIDFDSRGRPRPTNDFLQLLDRGVTRRTVDLEDGEVAALLRREAVPTEIEERGPIALRHRGDPLGRGAVTGDGLKSEIPKARAADYRRILEHEGYRPGTEPS